MIKLIATDMDGTLLTTDKRLPRDILPVVRALKEKGVSFSIASGRQYAALERDLGALKDDVIFIAENGALVMEKGRRLFIDPMPPEEVGAVIRATRGLEGVHAVICRAEGAIVEASAPQAFVEGMRMYYEGTEVAQSLLDVCDGLDDVCKIAFFDEGDAEHHGYPVLKELFGGRLSVILSAYSWVDVMKPGVNKGSAMRYLQRERGIAPQECMAFGDYLNDRELLESVSESYAMANAVDEIKKTAKYTAPSNDEDGVMRVIKERFSL